MRRVLIVLAGVVVAWLLWGRREVKPRPRVLPPVQVNTVEVVRTPYDQTQADKSVAFYAARVRHDPGGAIGYAMLAGACLQRGRERGDPADAKRAEQAARRSLAIRARGNAEALYLLAVSLITQHRFAEAEQTVEKGVRLYAGQKRFALLRAEAGMEIGEYEEAQQILDGIPDKDIFGQVVSAHLLEIRGKTERALEIFGQARQAAKASEDISHEAAAWFAVRHGDSLTRAGRLAEAEAAYRDALAIFPHDYRAMTGLARLAAMCGEWKWSVDWGQQAMDIAPSPEVAALLGDALSALGKKPEAEAQYHMVETMGRLAQAQGAIYDRQRALFYVDHGRNVDEALRLAEREIKVRKDIYAWDTLAWAHMAKDRFQEADAAMQKALAQGTQDAMLYFHAGLIALCRGEKERAKIYFQRALDINPRFHWRYTQKAKDLLTTL